MISAIFEKFFGRYPYLSLSAKQERDHLKKIDIRYLKKGGLLKGVAATEIFWTYHGQESGRVGLEICTSDLPVNYPFMRLR